MLLEYKVINDKWFCRRKDKPDRNYICYRTILCHILFNAAREDKSNSEKCLTAIIDAVENSGECINKYVEIYRYSNSGNQVIFLIDHTKGTFPLVFYSELKSSGSNRIDALKKSLNDLVQKKDTLFPLLNSKNEWSEELQDNLHNIFTYKKDEKNS